MKLSTRQLLTSGIEIILVFHQFLYKQPPQKSAIEIDHNKSVAICFALVDLQVVDVLSELYQCMCVIDYVHVAPTH